NDSSTPCVGTYNTSNESTANPGTGASTSNTMVTTITPLALHDALPIYVNLAHNTATVTFTFSEAPSDFSLGNVTATGGTLSGLSAAGTTYAVTFTGAADTDSSLA